MVTDVGEQQTKINLNKFVKLLKICDIFVI